MQYKQTAFYKYRLLYALNISKALGNRVPFALFILQVSFVLYSLTAHKIFLFFKNFVFSLSGHFSLVIPLLNQAGSVNAPFDVLLTNIC